jgi:hypothetical protein
MKLATADQVLERLNLAGIAATNTSVIDSALEGATTYLESELRSSLSYSERTDFFSYLKPQYYTFSPFPLWLSQRFLVDDATLYETSTSGTAMLDVSAGTALVLGTDYIQDKEKGKLTLIKEPNYGYSSLAVVYEAGYEEGDTDIPDWIVQAAVSAAILIHHTQGVIHSKKDAKDMTGPLASAVYSQINEKIVTPYQGLNPINTVVED